MSLLDLLISPAHAQAAPGADAGSPSFLIMMLVTVGIVYFIGLRPQMKRAKEHRALLAQLAKGDEVLAAGGLIGRVADIGDQFISIELAPNIVVKVQKGAITAVLPKGSLKAA